jgi:hypothetical protein
MLHVVAHARVALAVELPHALDCGSQSPQPNQAVHSVHAWPRTHFALVALLR